MNKYILLIFLFLVPTGFRKLSAEDHAIYISVIKIQHAVNASTASVYMRVFTDDFKNALRNRFGYESILEKPTFCTDYESYINEYFSKKFVCQINSERVEYRLMNCEKTEEVYHLEFIMDCPTRWNSAVIEAPFFMELFPNQSNIVNIENGSLKRFGRATKGNEVLKIGF